MLVCPEPTAVTVVPGIRLARACRLRVEVGIASSMSRLTTTVCRLLLTSTTGDSPVTVTVSSSAPSCRSPLTGAVKLPSSRMPARRMVLNPDIVKVTSYVPGGNPGCDIDRAESVTAADSFDERGTRRLDRDAGQRGARSRTTPAIAACACHPGRSNSAANTTTRLNRRRRIGSPPKDTSTARLAFKTGNVRRGRCYIRSACPQRQSLALEFHGFARFGGVA